MSLRSITVTKIKTLVYHCLSAEGWKNKHQLYYTLCSIWLSVSVPTWQKKLIIQLLQEKGEGEKGGRTAAALALGLLAFLLCVSGVTEICCVSSNKCSQQVGSLTWLTQDECHKSYRSQRIRAGEMNSAALAHCGCQWKSVRVGPIRDHCLSGIFRSGCCFSCEELSLIPFFLICEGRCLPQVL